MTRITIVKAHLGELESFRRSAATGVRRLEQVRWWAFREHFVAELTRQLSARHSVHASVTPDPEAGSEPEHISLTVDGEALDSPVIRL